MSDNLTTLIERTRCLLTDGGSLTWSEAELGECVHQAFDDINQAAGQTWSLAGLDAAASTDLPPGLASLLARGAAAYALFVVAARRADLFNFQPGICQAWTNAGEVFLKQFQGGLAYLAQVRLSGLHLSADAPFPIEDDASPGGWRLDDEQR